MRLSSKWISLSALAVTSVLYADPHGWEVGGGVLYWNAHQEGLAYTNKPSPVLTTVDFTQTSLDHPHFDWEFGFEAFATYAFIDSLWSLGLHWIHFCGDAHGHKKTDPLEGMFPVMSIAKDRLHGDYATSAHLHWDLHTNILDLIAKRETELSRRFCLNPTFGIRSIWLFQNAKATYKGGSFNAGTDHIKMKNHFYGIGPRVGLEPRLRLGSGFSLYGEGALALFYGHFEVSQRETFASDTQRHMHDHDASFRWIADLAAGLSWEHLFNCATLALDLGVDYLFFNHQNKWHRGVQHVPHHRGTDLTLWGYQLAVRLEF